MEWAKGRKAAFCLRLLPIRARMLAMADNNWVSEYKMLRLSGKETGPLGRNLQRTFVPGQYLPCVLGRNCKRKKKDQNHSGLGKKLLVTFSTGLSICLVSLLRRKRASYNLEEQYDFSVPVTHLSGSHLLPPHCTPPHFRPVLQERQLVAWNSSCKAFGVHTRLSK